VKSSDGIGDSGTFQSVTLLTSHAFGVTIALVGSSKYRLTPLFGATTPFVGSISHAGSESVVSVAFLVSNNYATTVTFAISSQSYISGLLDLSDRLPASSQIGGSASVFSNAIT
jgi:hypothetical protein